MNPYYQDDYGTLYLGKAEEVLPTLEDNSVDMVFTSPPYWMARKYVADDELGQEEDFRFYVQNLVRIFHYLKPKMKDSGNLFVNIGDKYFTRTPGSGGKTTKQTTNSGSFFSATKVVPLLPEGTLCNIPSLFSVAMGKDGWLLKHTLIWHKTNAFPTSNEKKFTVDYEFIYHFVLHTKKYYFVQQFEPSTQSLKDQRRNILRIDSNLKDPYKANAPRVGGNRKNVEKLLKRGRNKRSVWSIPIGKERGTTNHTAVFPVDLLETPIKACSPEIFGVVLDPFIGSGTTAIVAEKFSRKWIGIERKEEYCKEAIERILKERSKLSCN